jgi:hypothetical protein
MGTWRKMKEAKETDSMLCKVIEIAKCEGTYRKLQDGDRIERNIRESNAGQRNLEEFKRRY